MYGGLMMGQLSHVVGQLLPGRHGTSVKWTVNYRSALYAEEPACLTLHVVNVSPATGLVEARYRIACGDRLIAEGRERGAWFLWISSSAPDGDRLQWKAPLTAGWAAIRAEAVGLLRRAAHRFRSGADIGPAARGAGPSPGQRAARTDGAVAPGETGSAALAVSRTSSLRPLTLD